MAGNHQIDKCTGWEYHSMLIFVRENQAHHLSILKRFLLYQENQYHKTKLSKRYFL